MAAFYGNHFNKLLAYTTRAFEETIIEMRSQGKRALRILETGAGKINLLLEAH